MPISVILRLPHQVHGLEDAKKLQHPQWFEL
jgi:hypothetical protein